MTSLKICYIYNNKFGQYPILEEYCLKTNREGHKVFYIGISDSTQQFVSLEGITVSYVKQQGKLKMAQDIVHILKQIDPDIIHVFHFRGCFLIPFLLGKRKISVLDVRTIHVADKNGHHSRLSFLKNRLTWMESLFFKYSIALTTEIRKILKPSWHHIPIIPLGANPFRLQPPDKGERRIKERKRLHINEPTIVFIYSGTINPIRRVDDILLSFQKMKCNKSSLLIIAGDDKDDPGTLSRLKKLASQIGIGEKVIFTGFVDFNHLVNLYLASDIGLCFIPQTNFFDLQPPTKLFEYMAAGLVPIATNTSADKAIITDNINGFLCNDTVEDLSLTMSKVCIEFEEESKRIVSNALSSVQINSWDHIIDKYLYPYYECILKENRNEHC